MHGQRAIPAISPSNSPKYRIPVADLGASRKQQVGLGRSQIRTALLLGNLMFEIGDALLGVVLVHQ
jgi:hypothetical protein